MVDSDGILNRKILYSISGIQFDNLAKLYLGANNIESVEVLHRIRMHKIKEIHLESDYMAANLNHISNITQLRKSCFPHLNYFGLRKNYFIKMAT